MTEVAGPSSSTANEQACRMAGSRCGPELCNTDVRAVVLVLGYSYDLNELLLFTQASLTPSLMRHV